MFGASCCHRLQSANLLSPNKSSTAIMCVCAGCSVSWQRAWLIISQERPTTLQENLEAWMSKLSEHSGCCDRFGSYLECRVRSSFVAACFECAFAFVFLHFVPHVALKSVCLPCQVCRLCWTPSWKPWSLFCTSVCWSCLSSSSTPSSAWSFLSAGCTRRATPAAQVPAL